MPELPRQSGGRRGRPRCWFAALPGAGPCSGRLRKCHLVPAQLIRREVGAAAAWDSRTWVWGCGGPTGIGGHHGMLDVARTLRIPRHRLPAEVEKFAAEHRLGWWLDREYGPLEA